MNAFDVTRLSITGRSFEVSRYYDNDCVAPWDNEDGHGPMREIRSRADKRPGERLINRDRGYYAYDWQEAMRLAERDGWGLGDTQLAELAAKLGRKPTPGEVRTQAVQQDFDRLRGWVRDEWYYIGVAVRIIGPDGEPQGDQYAHTLWGVESDGDSWREVANELAEEIISVRAKAWRDCLQEARRVRYWASRDVLTK